MPHSISAQIPIPIQIVIDDVGWWGGENGSARQEPYRTGIDRNHTLADYEAIALLGRQLNMRPQAAFILCEWDKENILRDLPHSTWMGSSWDNNRWVGPWQEQAVQILQDNAAHIEFTLHGVGHEFWSADEQGEWTFSRAEWFDQYGTMREREEVLAHLDAYERIMQQHNLGSFPTSFVPCAFLYRFGSSEFANLLQDRGTRFVSTPFGTMHGADEVDHKWFGFDGEVMTVDRGSDLLEWDVIGTGPQGVLSGPICGMHWPNFLHQDPARNEEIVMAWVEFLRPYDSRQDRMLARDTAQFARQLAHHECTQVALNDSALLLDFNSLNRLPQGQLTGSFVIKVSSPVAVHFTSLDLGVEVNEGVASVEGSEYRLTVTRLSHRQETGFIDMNAVL